jgi:DegV family protein with EDD domain
MQVRRARELVNAGSDLDAIVTQLEAERSSYHLIFFADTLEYLQRGGRIGKGSQLLGSLLKIKPLLVCKDGEVEPYEKTRNRSRALEGIIEYALGFSKIEALSILHDGTDGDDVAHIRSGLAGAIDADRVIVSIYGPIVATHVGAGAMGLCLKAGSA